MPKSLPLLERIDLNLPPTKLIRKFKVARVGPCATGREWLKRNKFKCPAVAWEACGDPSWMLWALDAAKLLSAEGLVEFTNHLMKRWKFKLSKQQRLNIKDVDSVLSTSAWFTKGKTKIGRAILNIRANLAAINVGQTYLWSSHLEVLEILANYDDPKMVRAIRSFFGNPFKVKAVTA